MIKEAINELRKYTSEKKNGEKVEISVLQLNRVIKALEQGSCEDCVSRKAIIEEMEKRHAEGDFITKGFINGLPSVIPKEPQESEEV